MFWDIRCGSDEFTNFLSNFINLHKYIKNGNPYFMLVSMVILMNKNYKVHGFREQDNGSFREVRTCCFQCKRELFQISVKKNIGNLLTEFINNKLITKCKGNVKELNTL